MKPMPFSIARAGARSGPSVSAALWRLAGIGRTVVRILGHVTCPAPFGEIVSGSTSLVREAVREARPRTPSRLAVRAQTITVGPEPEMVAPSAPCGGAVREPAVRSGSSVRPVRLVQPVVERGREEVGRTATRARPRAGRRARRRRRRRRCGTVLGQRGSSLGGRERRLRHERDRRRRHGVGDPGDAPCPGQARRRRRAPPRGCRRGPRAASPTASSSLGVGLAARRHAPPRRARARSRRRSSRARAHAGSGRELEAPAVRRGRCARRPGRPDAPRSGAVAVGLRSRARSRGRARPRRSRSRGRCSRSSRGRGRSWANLHAAASAIAAEVGRHRDSGRRDCRAAVSGSLRPWPVMTQTTRVPAASPEALDARRDAGRGRRLAEDTLLARKRAPGDQDLLVGERVTTLPSSASIASATARGVTGSPIRIAVAIV